MPSYEKIKRRLLKEGLSPHGAKSQAAKLYLAQRQDQEASRSAEDPDQPPAPPTSARAAIDRLAAD